MHTIAIVNQKGGCGKTTTAINLAGVFAAQGYRTLLVDMDPQGHCAAGLAIPEQRIDRTIGDAMLAKDNAPVDSDRLLWRVSRNLDLAPSTTRLAALEAARGELASRPDPEQRLKKALARFGTQYDICLIDCSPAIGLLTFNSLVAADDVVVPVETGFFSLHGATKQVNAIKALAKRLGATPTYRLLPTLHDPNSMLSKDLLDEIRRRFPGKVIPIVIRYDVRLREAASFGQPVIEYAKQSTGAEDYSALATWLAENALSKSASERAAMQAAEDQVAEAEASDFAGLEQEGSGEELDSETIDSFDAGEMLAEQGHKARAQAESTNGHAAKKPHEQDVAAIASPGARAADVAARAKKMQQGKASGAPRGNASDAGGAPAGTIEPKPIEMPVLAPAISLGAATARSAGSLPAYGVRGSPELGGSARFVLPSTIGKRVGVAGEFNGWSSDQTPMRLNETGEIWEATVRMPAGANQYRLVVDGAWIADPYNPNVAPNPFGGTNSVVMVPPVIDAQNSIAGAPRVGTPVVVSGAGGNVGALNRSGT